MAEAETRLAEDWEENACEALVDEAGARRPLDAALRDDLVECLDLKDLFCCDGGLVRVLVGGRGGEAYLLERRAMMMARHGGDRGE